MDSTKSEPLSGNPTHSFKTFFAPSKQNNKAHAGYNFFKNK